MSKFSNKILECQESIFAESQFLVNKGDGQTHTFNITDAKETYSHCVLCYDKTSNIGVFVVFDDYNKFNTIMGDKDTSINEDINDLADIGDVIEDDNRLYMKLW